MRILTCSTCIDREYQRYKGLGETAAIHGKYLHLQPIQRVHSRSQRIRRWLKTSTNHLVFKQIGIRKDYYKTITAEKMPR